MAFLIAHRYRIRGLLVAQGLRLEPKGDFLQRLEALPLWDGAPLPLELKGELEREYQRLRLVEAQRRDLEKARKSRLRQADTAPKSKYLLGADPLLTRGRQDGLRR